jgi:hypothetical protein
MERHGRRRIVSERRLQALCWEGQWSLVHNFDLRPAREAPDRVGQRSVQADDRTLVRTEATRRAAAVGCAAPAPRPDRDRRHIACTGKQVLAARLGSKSWCRRGAVSPRCPSTRRRACAVHQQCNDQSERRRRRCEHVTDRTRTPNNGPRIPNSEPLGEAVPGALGSVTDTRRSSARGRKGPARWHNGNRVRARPSFLGPD